MPELWDPLTYETLMAGTVAHFKKQRLVALASNFDMDGPGIYALYYKGDMEEYQQIADGSHPIYVGKAVPPGSRKGGGGNINAPALRSRIRQHAKSIRQAYNLSITDFSFRWLAIVPVWIVFAEQSLIRQYRPVWNTCLEGFGKHDQGRRRRATTPSWWDTLHPGRPWAALRPQGIQGRSTAEARELVRTHFAQYFLTS